MTVAEEFAFQQTLARLEETSVIQKMKQFCHHRTTDTYHHCKNVALHSYRLAKQLHWKVSGKSLAVGAMLHDFYLYDTHAEHFNFYEHTFHHATRALLNADRHFALNSIEKDMIYSHMWPLNLTHFPRTRETFLICLSDKICAVKEVLRML